jgi:zinc/manganese transport system substrate-binding protein
METAMKRLLIQLCAIAAALATWPAAAALNIFACEPEWGALAKALAGEKASIYVATTAMQDPHRIEARPSLIARARSADLVVCTGAELEAGWLPLVQSQAGNPRIQRGAPGHFEAAAQVPLIDPPARLDRSQGDVHAGGNPHVHLDPGRIGAIAEALARRMAELDPTEAASYRKRAADFLSRWKEATARWEKQAAPLKGAAVVVHHKDLSYLLRWLGLKEAGSLEPKPGLPPSAAHLSGLLEGLKGTPVRAVLRSAYQDARAAQWLAERAGIPVIVLPYTVGGAEKTGDLFGLYEITITRLLQVAK